MAASVVCSSCGAKIKEGRSKCLRCGAALVPSANPTGSAAPSRAFVARHRGRLTIGACVVSVAVLLGVVISLRQPVAPSVAAQPGGVPPLQSPVGTTSPAKGSAPPAAPAFKAVTDLDAQRSGNAAYAQGDFAGALDSYELAVAKNPNNPLALNNLGQALVRVGRAKEAVPHFERATTLSPSDWAARFNLAHAYGEMGDWPRAIVEYEHAAQLFPEDYVTHYNLAMALHKASREEPAVAEFRRAIALAPSEPSFRLSLAISYEKLKRPAEAASAYEEYLALAPDASDASQVKSRIEALRNAPGPPQG